ncbi:hypothetical protein B0H11DRAFT_2226731 [Mycena galericulata]|nr:hypothetical protein B0H11DRAFT_2226731 [Mycena galericulata]
MARKSTGKSTARTRRLARASSPPAAPPPARLLGNLVGQHAPQLPPGPPAVITGPKTLLKVWAYNDEAPNVTTIPRTELWLELYGHKEALESVFLHPKMKIERYDHKSKDAAVVAGNVVRNIYSFVASRSSYITSRRPHAEIWLQRAVVAEGAVPLYMVKAYSKRNFLPKRQVIVCREINRRGSKFSPEQEAVIQTYLTEWADVIDRGNESKWKQTKVKEILALPLFVGKLPSHEDDKTNGATPAEWAERLKSKFKNRKQKLKTTVANTTSTSGSTQSTTAKSSGSPSLPSTRTHYLGHPTFSASKLFEIENKEAILEEARAAAGIAGVSRPFAFYQPSKKKLWAAVSVKEQEIYHERALKRQNDVDAHQLASGNGIWDDVQNFVKSGSYGDCTMTLLYGFRDPRGKLLRGVASAHFRDGDFFEETEGGSQLFERWKEYLESALPVRGSNDAAETVYEFLVNDDGVPLFPNIDLYKTAGCSVASALQQYIRRVWEHCRFLCRYPWSETLDFKEIPIVADYFVKTQDDDAFIFNAETGGSKDDGSAADDVHESNDDVAKPKPKKKQAKKDKGKKAGETPKDDVPEPPEGGKSGNSGGDKAIELEDDVPKSPAHGNSGNSGGDKAIEDKHDAPEPPEGGKSGNSGGDAVHAPKGRGRTAEKPKAADTQGGNKARGAKRPRVDKDESEDPNAKKRPAHTLTKTRFTWERSQGLNAF